MRIFLAGATGAIGRRLVPLLVAAGHTVTGTTRSSQRAGLIAALGATPAVVDALEPGPLEQAIAAARPDVILHQLTDLPQARDDAGMDAALRRNAHLRVVATRNLMAAARAHGVGRVIAQSIAFAYAAGDGARSESDPLDLAAQGLRAVTVRGIAALEADVLGAPGITGLVLRYGRLYGPGTWYPDAAGEPPALHVDAAARAAQLALDRGRHGIYNIAEDDGAVAIARAREELGFDPQFRLPAER
jgi:nucleoside-diphosphate-sugar epimerase